MDILIKLGVGGTNLHLSHEALWTIPPAWNTTFPNTPLIITSTWEGTHHPSSFHYRRRAWDLRRPANTNEPTITTIQHLLGHNYTVLDEQDHIHIHYQGP